MKMWMATAILLAASTAAPAHGADEGAARLLAEMRAACGGDAWDRVRGWHETNVVQLPGGPTVRGEVWHDMHALKSAMTGRVDGRIVRRVGFDGATYWRVAPDGSVEAGTDAAIVRRHRRDTYLSSFGWFFPDRFPAEFVLASNQAWEGTSLQVLRITPENADPFELWVDPATHLVRRIVAGNEHADLSDYRTFDGVCTATVGRQGSGDPSRDLVLRVEDVDTEAPAPAGTFAPPPAAPPGSE